MSIKTKLLIALAALVAAGFVVTAVVTIGVTRASMLGRVDATLVDASRRPPTPQRAVPSPPPDVSDGDNPARRELAVLIFDRDGTLADAVPSGFVTDPDPLPDISADNLTIGVPFTTTAVDDTSLRFRALATEMQDGRVLVVATSLANMDATVRELVLVWIGTGAGILGLLIAAAWFLIRRGLRPVDDMIETATHIADGDLSQRIEHTDPVSEVGRLGAALNTMLTQIEAAFATREASEARLRQFVADASHELRTPLTAIRGYAELYRSGAASTPDEVGAAMGRIESESLRMGKLVEDLLLLARLDQGRPLQNEDTDIVALCADVVADARAVDPDRTVTFEHPERVIATADEDKLRQVVANLVTNACVHTDPDTPVHVRVEENADAVKIIVADEGQGMDADVAAHVFDRFYRPEHSRSRGPGGTGLGLSIVRSVVDAHRGEIVVDTAPGEGARFIVTVPT